MEVDGAVASAARRRRERRLRSWWKHEQQTVRMVLSAAAHHSFDKVAAGETFNALRGQKTDRARREVEERELHDAPRRQKPPPPGTRPAPLVEVRPQGAMVQHSGIGFELLQALDVPVLQLVEQPVDVESFFRISVPAVAEQVIDVPKLAFPILAVQRAALPEPQLVEQLVEVPTVLSVAVLQQRTAEQIIGFPVPGRGGGARGGLQGLSQGQGSTAVCGAENVDTPVPHGRGRLGGGGLHGLSQGQGSTAVCGAENVTPVPHGRGRLGGGGLHGLSQGQGSTAVMWRRSRRHSRSSWSCWKERSSRPLPVEQGSSAVDRLQEDRVPQRLPVPHGRVGARGLQGFPRGQGSTASAVEQTFSQAPHRSKPRAPVHGRHDEWVCVVDVENDGEYFWNRLDNSSCWRLPRGVKHRWCLLPSGLYRDVVLQVDYRVLPPL